MGHIQLIQNRIQWEVFVAQKIMKSKEQVFQLLVDSVHNVMTFQP